MLEQAEHHYFECLVWGPSKPSTSPNHGRRHCTARSDRRDDDWCRQRRCHYCYR
jgi:hypothetical protein